MRRNLKFAFALGSNSIDPHQPLNALMIALKPTLM
jgi:hypothetical protein